MQQFKNLVLPVLVPLYGPHHKHVANPVQVGTGFLIDVNSRPVLITAKHVLIGHSGNEDAGEKAFFESGRVNYVGDNSREIFIVRERDLACFYVDELSNRPRFNLRTNSGQAELSQLITFGGFLVRDFRRNSGTLRPQPLMHTAKVARVSNGLVCVEYHNKKVFSQTINKRTKAPIPRGLSGGPMFNTVKLVQGEIDLLGVFTEQSNGTARGEPYCFLRKLIDGL